MTACIDAEERELIANCEHCRAPIYDGDMVSVSADGVMFCEKHCFTLQDVVDQHDEILSKVPWDCGELEYETRDEMVKAYRQMKADLDQNGNRKLVHAA